MGPAYVSIYFFGTGMSGTIICVFRLITLATMGENPNSKAVLIYFCVAGAWNIIGMFIWWKFTKTDHYRVVIKHAIKLKKSAKPSEEPLS